MLIFKKQCKASLLSICRQLGELMNGLKTFVSQRKTDVHGGQLLEAVA